MGKGRIVSVDGDGAYQIELVHDMEPIERLKAALEESRAELLEPLAKARHDADVARADAAGARGRLDQAITNGDEAWMQEAAEESVRAAGVAYSTEANWAVINAEYSAKTQEIWTLESALTQRDPVVVVWCADYTVDLDQFAEVGTIEIPDEYQPTRPVIIQPAYRPDDPQAGAAWNSDRDGCMMRADAQGPYQAYFNSVMLPGLQKYKPFYRVADLLQVDGDTGSIVVDRENSSASQSAAYKRFTTDAFPVNAPGADVSDNAMSFEAVIIYMDCNGAAFQEGDRVVVYFGGDWGNPQIIGFETNPKPCLLTGFLLLPCADGVERNGWGEPFTEENKPLGTIAADPVILPAARHGNTIVTPNGEFLRGGDNAYLQHYPIDGFGPVVGNCDWSGEALGGGLLTWSKPGGRYFGDVIDEYNGEFTFAISYLPGQIIMVDWGGAAGWKATEIISTNADGSKDRYDDMNKGVNFGGYRAAGITASATGRINGCGAIEHQYVDDDGNDAIATWIITASYDIPVAGSIDHESFSAKRVVIENGVVVYDGAIIDLGRLDYNETDGAASLTQYGNWSFSQSGRSAAAIRNDPRAEPTVGYNLLYELSFVADENTVIMAGPVVTIMPNGLINWTRSFGPDGNTQYTGGGVLRETIAADYKNNRLVLAELASDVFENVNISTGMVVGDGTSYKGYMSNGTHLITAYTRLLIDGSQISVIEDLSRETTATFTYSENGSINYQCQTTKNNNIKTKDMTAFDLRNGYVAYAEVINKSGSPEQFSGSGPSRLSVSWSGTEGRIFDGQFFDNYPPLASIDAGSVSLDRSGPVSGSNDPLDSRNSTGIDITWIVLLADPGIDSGSIEVFGVDYQTFFYRPSPIALSKSGDLVAMSSGDGFGRPTWYFQDGGVKNFTNWPSSLADDAGLAGKLKPRLCPVSVL